MSWDSIWQVDIFSYSLQMRCIIKNSIMNSSDKRNKMELRKFSSNKNIQSSFLSVESCFESERKQYSTTNICDQYLDRLSMFSATSKWVWL